MGFAQLEILLIELESLLTGRESEARFVEF